MLVGQVPVSFGDEEEHRRKIADALNALIRVLDERLKAIDARLTALEAP